MQTEGLIMNKHRQTHERSYKAWRDMQSLWWQGCREDSNFCRARPKQDESGTQDKLTLNSSTSSSCKQEAWRLKRDSKTSSGVRGEEETRLCRGHAAKHKQTNRKWPEMGGHQTVDISPCQPEECVLWLRIWCIWHIVLCFLFFIFLICDLCIELKFALYFGFAVWRECLQGAVMHRSSDRLWLNTHTHTQTEW